MIPHPDRQVDVSIAEPFQEKLSEEWLRLVVGCAMEVALPDGRPGQVGLAVTDDATVRRLNREFRGLDEGTDVLSFSGSHPAEWQGEGEAPEDRYLQLGDGDEPVFVLPPDEVPPLGEVIISYPQARRQARERNEPVDKELALLVVHGVLHLVGHDHTEPEDAARMQAKERAALASVFQVGMRQE